MSKRYEHPQPPAMPAAPEMAALQRALQAFGDEAGKHMKYPLQVKFEAAFLGSTGSGMLFPPGFVIRSERDMVDGPATMSSFELQKAMRSGLDAMNVAKHDVARVEHGVWIGVNTARGLIEKAIVNPQQQAGWFANGFAQALQQQGMAR